MIYENTSIFQNLFMQTFYVFLMPFRILSKADRTVNI